MTETLEHTARRIAERGRDALLARLRPAFTEAARAHSDVLSLDGDQLEQIVQRAADRADGLQWRRALADVATEELGISLGEALSHPAVARAQAIVGAPSYEESLAALAPARGRQPKPAQRPADEPEHHPAGDEAQSPTGRAAAARDQAEAEDDELEADDDDDEAWAEDDELEADDEAGAEDDELDAAHDGAGAEDDELDAAHDGAGAEDDELEAEHGQPSSASDNPVTAERLAVAPDDDDDEDDTLRLVAVHLGGIANLKPAEPGIELLLSEDGLDIARGSDELLGRLRWPEIRSLDVSTPRGLRRRRRSGAHLVIRTRHGDATFEIPETSSKELQTQLKPLLRRHASG